MEPDFLKSEYGDKFVFWGGGIDSQHTLPFGSPQDVQNEVQKNLEIFSENGGYVFANVHNIQNQIPVENLLSMFDTFNKTAL